MAHVFVGGYWKLPNFELLFFLLVQFSAGVATECNNYYNVNTVSNHPVSHITQVFYNLCIFGAIFPSISARIKLCSDWNVISILCNFRGWWFSGLVVLEKSTIDSIHFFEVNVSSSTQLSYESDHSHDIFSLNGHLLTLSLIQVICHRSIVLCKKKTNTKYEIRANKAKENKFKYLYISFEISWTLWKVIRERENLISPINKIIWRFLHILIVFWTVINCRDCWFLLHFPDFNHNIYLFCTICCVNEHFFVVSCWCLQLF